MPPTYAARAAEVRAAFAAEYVDENGDLPVRLQGVYVLALAFDMVPVELRDRTAAARSSSSSARAATGSTPASSRRRTCSTCCATTATPRSRARCSGSPRCRRGSTRSTAARRRSGSRGMRSRPTARSGPMSFNHYAPGSVDDWLYRRVAGIRSTSPGYRTAVIEPDFDAGVDHVRGARRHAVRAAGRRVDADGGCGIRHGRCAVRRGSDARDPRDVGGAGAGTQHARGRPRRRAMTATRIRSGAADGRGAFMSRSLRLRSA